MPFGQISQFYYPGDTTVEILFRAGSVPLEVQLGGKSLSKDTVGPFKETKLLSAAIAT